MRVKETKSEAARATTMDSPKSLIKRPKEVLAVKSRGTNTIIVVRVAAKTGRLTSPAPFTAACTGLSPSSRRRWMFSSTTTLLSTSIPTASMSPLNEIIFKETSRPGIRPSRNMKVKVQRTEMGMARAMIRVVLTFHRNRKSMITAIIPPMIPAFRRFFKLFKISLA